MIKYLCDQCESLMQSPDEMADLVEVCPSCGAAQRVPAGKNSNMAATLAAGQTVVWIVAGLFAVTAGGIPLMVLGAVALATGVATHFVSRARQHADRRADRLASELQALREALLKK